MKHYLNVCDIHGDQVEPVDVITFGSPCFIAGTLVQTNRGILPIESVMVGDFVLTHTNTYKRVEKVGSKLSNSILKINIMGSPEIVTTENHPFYVRKSKRDITDYSVGTMSKKEMGQPEWIQAKDLTKDYYIGMSINHECKNDRKLTACECYLIGRYIADGYLKEGHRNNRGNSYHHSVIYCIGKEKLEDFRKNVTDYQIYEKRDKTAIKCEIISQRLVDLCKECGQGAINKTIPQFIMDLPIELLECVIEGYMSGDGSHPAAYQATTISRNLAYQLQAAVAKVYHTYAKIYFTKRPETYRIEGRIVNQHDTYLVRFQKERRKKDSYIYQDDMLWIPFKNSYADATQTMVFNMQVESDNSYTANNFTVHNCQDLSVAGKRAGLKHEANGDHETTRSGLFMEAVRIIKEMRKWDEENGRTNENIRPRFAVWENVPGAFSSNGGKDFRIVLEELARVKEAEVSIPMPETGKWKQAGEIVGDGWSIAWRTLDAQYHGVPQRRRRIFLVADFAGECAGEILFECNGLPGYPTESANERERVADNLENGIGGTSTRECVSQSNSIENGNNQSVICIQGSMIGRKDENGPQGNGINIDKSFTLNTVDKHAIAYGISSYESYAMLSKNPHSGIYEADTARTLDLSGGNPACNQGGICVCESVVDPLPSQMTCYTASSFGGYTEGCGTLKANGGDLGGGSETLSVEKQANHYIVRKLTPIECARLQGMPDLWCALTQIEDMTDEDYEFWKQAHQIYSQINGKPYKEKSKQQMIAWYNKLQKDGAEYKAYGNGMALPCVRVPIHGIAQRGAKTMASLFDGIGGFPLAGLIDGIKTLWTSEIELFPIAVTMERFREFEKYGYFTFGNTDIE